MGDLTHIQSNPFGHVETSEALFLLSDWHVESELSLRTLRGKLGF